MAHAYDTWLEGDCGIDQAALDAAEELEQRFADAPASVRADLAWDFIDTPNRKVGHDLRADFMEYVAKRDFPDTDAVHDAIALIRRAMAWSSSSGREDLERAIQKLQVAA